MVDAQWDGGSVNGYGVSWFTIGSRTIDSTTDKRRRNIGETKGVKEDPRDGQGYINQAQIVVCQRPEYTTRSTRQICAIP